MQTSRYIYAIHPSGLKNASVEELIKLLPRKMQSRKPDSNTTSDYRLEIISDREGKKWSAIYCTYYIDGGRRFNNVPHIEAKTITLTLFKLYQWFFKNMPEVLDLKPKKESLPKFKKTKK